MTNNLNHSIKSEFFLNTKPTAELESSINNLIKLKSLNFQIGDSPLKETPLFQEYCFLIEDFLLNEYLQLEVIDAIRLDIEQLVNSLLYIATIPTPPFLVYPCVPYHLIELTLTCFIRTNDRLASQLSYTQVIDLAKLIYTETLIWIMV